MPPQTPGTVPIGPGLEDLRRPGRVTELLLLYELATRPQGRLRPLARSLGVSVQAVSYLQRHLVERGWAESAAGTYRPTVRGIAALHAAIGSLQDDLEQRAEHLRLVRTCRAVAQGALSKGDPVSLEMVKGILRARRGKGGSSTGEVIQGGKRGDLVEVGHLEGILKMTPRPVQCWVVPESPAAAERALPSLRASLRAADPELLAAEGLEAYHLLSRCLDAPITRLGVASALREASQLGVPSLVLVTPDRLPTLLRKLSDPAPQTPVVVRSFGL